MTGLGLTVLGVFQARLSGRPLVNFRPATVRGLLILLALTRPRPHQRDVLAGLLWPSRLLPGDSFERLWDVRLDSLGRFPHSMEKETDEDG